MQEKALGLCICYSWVSVRASDPNELEQIFLEDYPSDVVCWFPARVFFIFSTMGLTTDIMEMGREPTLRFVLGVLLSGLFAMFYAFTGFALRKQF